MSGLLIDCFAGGGGASKGIELALNRPIDIAVNHDPEAIRIHKVNHPNTLHLTEDIFTVDLQKYVAGRSVDLMWASPDCTSHSKAKGGQPRHQGLRILPWAVYKHAKAILPEIIIMFKLCQHLQRWTSNRALWASCQTVNDYRPYIQFLTKWPDILRRHQHENHLSQF